MGKLNSSSCSNSTLLLHFSLSVFMGDSDMIDSKQKVMMSWQVYIILCSDDSLYTGITTDIRRRYAQHQTGAGAKYFRGRSPCRVVYLENDHDRSSASCRESQIKKLRPVDKWRLITASVDRLEEEMECVEVIRRVSE